uniref:Uncharacterized protein n=1 Tax=Physcomitrium patens TaxID=3218 RepID=A0A2K1JRK5_PHYPA|nr:hypothetical protein PHYPA_016545 [Physcomitrium patens]
MRPLMSLLGYFNMQFLDTLHTGSLLRNFTDFGFGFPVTHTIHQFHINIQFLFNSKLIVPQY